MEKGPKRDLSLWITGSILLSSLVSISVMALAPGNVLRIGEVPTIFIFIQRILTYPIDFIVDSIKTFPLPSTLTVLVPFLIVFLLNDADRQNYLVVTSKKLLTSFLAAPIILYILLMTNFSPSAYALAYPADRALFEARYLMTLILIFEGALLGFYLSQMKSPFLRSMYTKYFALVILTIFSFYPLRSALQTAATFDFYRQRAASWDLRDAKIRAAQKNGEMIIIVQEFDSLHGIKELDKDPKHWVNRCAARYYEVDSISAYPLDSE